MVKREMNRYSSNTVIANFYLSELAANWLATLSELCTSIQETCSFKFNEGRVVYSEKGKPSKHTQAAVQSLLKDVYGHGLASLFSIYFGMIEKKGLSLVEFSYHRKQDSYKPYHHLFLQMETTIFNKAGLHYSDYFKSIFDQIGKVGKVEYGFLHTMPVQKMSLAYFSGFFNDQLTEEEEYKLRVWKDNKQKYNLLVWDVLLGNILRKKILSETLIAEIESIVGSQNFIMHDDIVIFFLPIELDDWIMQNERALKIKTRLIDLFKAKNLLMERAPKAVSTVALVKSEPLDIAKSVKTVNYRGPVYIEQYLVKGSEAIIEKIEEEYSMVTSGIGRTKNKKFNLFIDEKEKYVIAKDSEGTIVLYDPSKHPANIAFGSTLDPQLQEYKCTACGENIFEIVVGFEYPEDADGPDDISSFALAGKCLKCKNIEILFEDETA